MIDDDTAHRVFKIGELARLIARQLTPDDQESVLNLACACRYLEEPVLSTLWETQDSLTNLLEALPRDNWRWSSQAVGDGVVRDLNLLLELNA